MDDVQIECPECAERFRVSELIFHIRDTHPLLFLVWSSVFPWSQEEGGVGAILPSLTFDEDGFQFSYRSLGEPPIFIEEDGDDGSEYEALLALCERMGNHEIGVDNVDAVMEEVDADDPNAGYCPICLEVVPERRRLKLCKHAFCGGCVRTWLQSHKTCPLCKQDVEAS
jgi:hypothetical protein